MSGSRLAGRFGDRGLLAFGLILLGGLLVVGVASGAPAAMGDDDDATVDRTVASTTTAPPANVSEEGYVESAPERGDEWYEATDPDGHWISYDNPRDEYRSPYLGGGSGKICVTLLNEAGEPIVGETVPNTTVTIPTGEELEWHPHADPMVVQYPLTDHYERPLDADQFGTSDDVPQGDGYMDTHCIEMHGQPEDATIEYGEAQIDGEYAEDIELVGYVQQAHTPGWDTDIDPIAAAESYDETGGGWTYQTDHSHGQAVVVLQLDRDTGEQTADDENGQDQSDDGEDRGDETSGETGTDDGTDENQNDELNETNGTDDSDDGDAGTDQLPGFGAIVAIVAVTVAALLASRQ